MLSKHEKYINTKKYRRTNNRSNYKEIYSWQTKYCYPNSTDLKTRFGKQKIMKEHKGYPGTDALNFAQNIFIRVEL